MACAARPLLDDHDQTGPWFAFDLYLWDLFTNVVFGDPNYWIPKNAASVKAPSSWPFARACSKAVLKSSARPCAKAVM